MRKLLLLLVVSTKVIAMEHKSFDTDDLQKFQSAYDDQFFEINHDFEKLRHIVLHLMKSVGKAATYCEAKEHGRETDNSKLVNEVVPDLLMHALQIANLFDIDLGEKYEERINFTIERIKSQRN